MAQHPPAQKQPYPGQTKGMVPRPRDEMREYTGSGLLRDKRTLIAGGDSGIGRAVAAAFAKEGADVAIAYLSEHEDARHTAGLVEGEGRRSLLLPGDLADEAQCTEAVERTAAEFGGLDVLVAHHAVQTPVQDFAELSTEQLRRTFDVNVLSVFWLLRAAIPKMPDGGSVIVTGSINGLRGNSSLIDYAASKAAVMNLTHSLAQHYMKRGIRVNCVAPGPVWTPLIPATLPEEKVEGFGQQAPMERAADPDEIAPSYVFFASGQLSSYYSGQVLTPVGGEIQVG
ncbi:SDR family oxidoreductase [Thermobifida halotolerans]|uniref:SDR family oxidoreductase n=1 Tax=Thermobifida halotolerans TaxID=483545 RepID=A0A399G4W0_9ACTN|nr:SDR family oxidoreductase [Thermobifida halotolerans]UOE20783.1 SDR family oxidoreductase [Thermobifida halotolerans]